MHGFKYDKLKAKAKAKAKEHHMVPKNNISAT